MPLQLNVNTTQNNGATTFSMMTLSRMTFSIITRKCDTQQNDTSCLCRVSLWCVSFIKSIMLNIALCYIVCRVGIVINESAREIYSWLFGTIAPVPICHSWTVFQWDYLNQSCPANLISCPAIPLMPNFRQLNVTIPK